MTAAVNVKFTVSILWDLSAKSTIRVLPVGLHVYYCDIQVSWNDYWDLTDKTTVSF